MFKPIPKDQAAVKKAKEADNAPAAKPEALRVHKYRWPGEAPEGRGDFNRVGDQNNTGRRFSEWMRR